MAWRVAPDGSPPSSGEAGGGTQIVLAGWQKGLRPSYLIRQQRLAAEEDSATVAPKGGRIPPARCGPLGYSSASTRTAFVRLSSPTCSRAAYAPGGTTAPRSASARRSQTTCWSPARGTTGSFATAFPSPLRIVSVGSRGGAPLRWNQM